MRIGHVILMAIIAVVFTIVGWQLGEDSGLAEYLDAEIRDAISETQFEPAEKLIADLRPIDEETAERYSRAVEGLKERIEQAREEARQEASRSGTQTSRSSRTTQTTRSYSSGTEPSPTTTRSYSSSTASSSGAAASPGGYSRTMGGVERAAAGARDVVAACYSIGLASNPTLSGRVNIRFTVNSAGDVTSAQVTSSTLGDSNVEECVVSAVQSWKFAAGSGSRTFDYPFTFEPG